MANVLQYVDWDGLVYYDGKIKDYIEQKEAINIKFGGEYLFNDLPAPSIENVNYVYRVVDTFSTSDKDDWFVNDSPITYNSGTLLQCISDSNGICKYDDFVASGGTLDVDLSKYYTKEQVDDLKADAEHVHNLSDIIDYEAPNLEPYALKTDLSPYATTTYVDKEVNELQVSLKDYTDEAISKIPQTDLGNYVTKEEIKDVASQEYVDEALAGIVMPTVPTKLSDLNNDCGYINDISHLATKDDLGSFLTEVPTEYITEAELDAKGYLTQHQSLDGYAKLEDLPKDYLVESDLEGYSKFSGSYNDLTDKPIIPKLDGYATESYVDNKLDSISIPTKLSDLENDSKYATESMVQANTTLINGVSTNLTALSELHNSQFTTLDTKYTNLDNKVDNIENELDNKLTLTQAEQSFLSKTELTNINNRIDSVENSIPQVPTKVSAFENDSKYVNEEFVTQAINNIDIPKVDLSDYATTDMIPTKVSELENDKKFLTEIPDIYVTEDELNNKGFITDVSNKLDTTVYENDKSTFALKSELFSKDYNDLENLPTIPSTEGLATEDFVREQVSNIPPVDLGDYYNKNEVDNLIPDVSNFITNIPSEYITEDELNSKGFITEHQDLSNYALKSEIPDVSSFITDIPDEYITTSELNDKGYLTQHQDISHKADNVLFNEDYVVNSAFGAFVVGDNVKGMTIKDILIKLLNLKTVIVDPVEQIKESQAPVYQLNADGSVTEVEYKLLEMTTENDNTPPTSSGFYQITDENGEVVESGYQVMTIQNDSCFYKVLLPDYVDLSSKGRVDYYDELNNDHWFTCYAPGDIDNEIRVIDDLNIIKELYGDDYYLPLVAEEEAVPGYNMWIIDPDNTSTGKTYRIVIE